MKKIELVFPVVKVTVEDISNMQNILLGGKCAVSEKGLARLRAMGLSKIEKLPPCPKLMAEWELKSREAGEIDPQVRRRQKVYRLGYCSKKASSPW